MVKVKAPSKVADKLYLTVYETMDYLGSSRQFIYNLVNDGKLHAYKVGRRTYFKRNEVEKLFEIQP